MKKDAFGINMKKWCKEHEEAVMAALSEGKVTPDLIELHEEKLKWLQHERLIHLIVTVMTTIIELFVFDLTLLHPELGIYPVFFMLLFTILLAFYFFHYFFLENTVQRWYKLAELLRSK